MRLQTPLPQASALSRSMWQWAASTGLLGTNSWFCSSCCPPSKSTYCYLVLMYYVQSTLGRSMPKTKEMLNSTY